MNNNFDNFQSNNQLKQNDNPINTNPMNKGVPNINKSQIPQNTHLMNPPISNNNNNNNDNNDNNYNYHNEYDNYNYDDDYDDDYNDYDDDYNEFDERNEYNDHNEFDGRNKYNDHNEFDDKFDNQYNRYNKSNTSNMKYNNFTNSNKLIKTQNNFTPKNNSYNNFNKDYNTNNDGWITRHKVAFSLILTFSLIFVITIIISALYLSNNLPQIQGSPIAKVLDNISNKSDSDTFSDEEVAPVSSSVIDSVTVAPIDDFEDPEPQQNVDHDTFDVGAKVAASDVRKTVQPYETSGVTLGIDVSKWQGTINWESVAKTGVDYAIIRIGYRASSCGRIFEDPFAKYNMQEAQAAGIKIGVYFFSTAKTVQEATEEATWTCKIISQYKITYPVVFDYEGYDKSGNRNSNLDASTRTKIATCFLDYVEKQGYTGMFYSSKSGLENDFDTSSISSKYKIWIAQYPKTAYPQTTAPDYSGSYDMWQYTANGTVNGITGYADINVAKFGFDKETSAKNSKTPETVKLDPEIGIDFTECSEQVTAKIEVNLREKPSSLEESKIVATLKNGDTAKRTATGSNGWSRLTYNDQILYAVTSFLTTDLNDTSQIDAAASQADTEGFSSVNETVTPKESVNLRDKPNSDDSKVIATVKNGTKLTRIGVNPNGWSKLTYNNKTVYAITTYLTTDLNAKPASQDEASTDSTYTTVNEQVTAKDTVNLRTEVGSTSDDTIVASLKNGTYVTRTGVGSNGWSKLEYDGKTVYAISSYLEVKK